MALFHPRVLNRHTEHVQIDAGHVALLKKWADNVKRGIYDSETQNDSEFIQQILVNILGYVGSSDGKEWTVAKNQPIGNLNVDVALGQFTVDSTAILAPFELKGAKTNLDTKQPGYNDKTPVEQAWNYANGIEGVKWVLVSNYREIRLYAYGKGNKNCESFDLTTLTVPENYKRFLFLLSAKNLLDGTTLALLNESGQTEKAIADGFYEVYKDFRKRLVETIAKDNAGVDKLDIIRHVQTILDRILFIAFAEDRGLLPENTLDTAYKATNPYKPLPIWENFVGLFKAINEGNTRLNIPEYNGGLFADDPELNALKISDKLCEGFKRIGEYDFESEISVNILGHIFEQSINDLEELRAIANEETDTHDKKHDKKKGQKKAEGVFYTPPYITHYIVEQAVGGYLADKRNEIGFDTLPVLTDADFDSVKPGKGKRKKPTFSENIKKHIEAWKTYEMVLSNIKVLDPACGSGAFLIEVFDYLYKEGQAINSELARLEGERFLFRWDTHILANNLYGVDLNRESVEITKLSLWLKTARRNEKLTYLENNIKPGNSLIDDKAVAGDLAFDWKEEFADIMANGGFDVVVGNPPYGAHLTDSEKTYLTNFDSLVPDFETSIYFISLYKKILKSRGRQSYIVPNTFLSTLYGKKYRDDFFVNTSVYQISDLSSDPTFEGASVRTCIFSLIKETSDYQTTLLTFKDNIFKPVGVYSKSEILQETQNILGLFAQTSDEKTIIAKILKHPPLNDFFMVSQGLIPYDKYRGHDEYTIKNRIWHCDHPKDHTYRKELKGGDVNRYTLTWNERLWISYGNWLAAPRDQKFFTLPRLLIREITADLLFCTYTEEEYYNTPSIINVIDEKNILHLKYCLVILNSRLIGWLHNKTSPKAKKGLFPKILINDIRNIPLVNLSQNKQKLFIGLAERMLSLHTELQNRRRSFLEPLMDNFDGLRITAMLERFDELDFLQFVSELKKQKIELAVKKHLEWKEYFYETKNEIETTRENIRRTDAKIDRMVYELYGLTDEEVRIIG